MKKRFLSILLVLAMCAALLPTIALADAPALSGAGTPEAPWILRPESFSETNTSEDSNPKWNSGFGDSGNYSLASGSYKLGENIELDRMIQIPYNAVVTLDLNDCALQINVTNGEGICIYEGASFTLEDSSAGQSGYLSAKERGVDNDGRFTMNGGRICNVETGVLNDGTFTMNGGKITDCETIIKNKSSGKVKLPNNTTLAGKIQSAGDFSFAGNTFTGEVEHGGSDNTEFGGTDNSINGGVFRCPVENGFRDASFYPGTIKGGVFYKEVNNNAFNGSSSYKYSTIEGGVFYGNVTNMEDDGYAAEINGGVFYGDVTNNGTINGGVFLGGIDGNMPTPSHTITLYFNDDADTVKTGVVVGNKLYPLGEPPIEREGYSFAGWYEDEALTQPADFETELKEGENVTFYAKWTRNPSGEDFVIAGGLLSGLLEGAANALEETFVDVSRGAYYYNAVEWAAERGIAGGVDKKHFAPDESCTRAQAVTMLWRAAGCPAVWTENPFEDVDADDYYYEAVLWAVANGITSGADETHFSPDAPCTRGQIVTFLHRAARCYDAHENFGFTDVKAGSYCEDAINWAVENTITNGTDVGAFSPDAPCTRAQIVTFLYRNR